MGDASIVIVGVDVIRDEGLSKDVDVVPVELNSENVPLPDGKADVVAAVETIEHLENPRACTRQRLRLTKVGARNNAKPTELIESIGTGLVWRQTCFGSGLSAGSPTCGLSTAFPVESYIHLATAPDSSRNASHEPCQTIF